MANTYFSFKKFTIRQEDTTLKVTTDACLLGAYASASSPEKILDIGTGTGILALMAAQRFTGAMIEGIEPDEGAAAQARINVASCHWKERISIRTCRIQDYTKSSEHKFDLILSNPPYHTNQLAPEDPRKRLARHSSDLTLHDLSVAVEKLVSGKGRFYVILPPEPFERIREELLFSGIRLFDKLIIESLPAKPCHRLIGGFSRAEIPFRQNSLLIRDEKDNYSRPFRELLKDFYLGF